MTQQEFLKLLIDKYKFSITGYGEKEIDITVNPNKTYWYFLIPYSKRTVRNNIFSNKQGELFTIQTINYTIKDNQTGEITYAYIPRSKILYTTLYQRDLVILEANNNYDKQLALLLTQYQILQPKRLPLFYRTNKDTFLSDMKGIK